MAFIYKTVNLVNGKVYIGKSKYNNPTYFGSGLKIIYAIKKYGIENFKKEIIEECDEKIINEREIFWISTYNSQDDSVGYNISNGGEGGRHYFSTLTEEERKAHNKKISDSRKGKSQGPLSESTKEKMSKSFNRDPEILSKRAESKRKFYTCIKHDSKEVFYTKNLKDFCLLHGLNHATMQHNARTRKTICNLNWSCREGKLEGSNEEIVRKIELEIDQATKLIKEKLSKRDKHGINNPMFGRKHSDETRKKMSEIRIRYAARKNNNTQ